MAKQILELRIELTGINDSNIENRKLDLLTGIAKILKEVQSNSRQYDGSGSVTVKSSFASNLDLFKELPNSLETENKEN